MKINEAKLASLDACDKDDIDIFRCYPNLDDKGAELGGFSRWVASKGKAEYVFWLLSRLMTPEGATRWGILAAKRHYHDADWNKWADSWLSGEDRTPESAVMAVRATEAAEAVVRATEARMSRAAEAAVRAARAAAWASVHLAQMPWETVWAADNAAAHAYNAATSTKGKASEIECQISDALEIIGKEG